MSCDCCGQPKNFNYIRRPNYQKLVEIARPASEEDDDEEPKMPENHQLSSVPEVPLIGPSPVVEYRVTSDMRHKPADIPGVRYVQNFSALDHNDRNWWLLRKQQKTQSWIGDGNYKERRSDHLHHFGFTTHDLQETQYCLLPPPPCFELVYHTTLLKRPSPPKPHTRIRQPCTALAATRSGVKYVLPMDCEKYLSKQEMTSVKPERKKCCYDTGNKHEYYPRAEIPSRKLDVKRCDDDVGKKIVICLPRDKELAECCKKPCNAKKMPIENVRVFLPDERPLKKPKPTVKDYMYRCESRELIGSKLLKYCECVKRNGLQDRCPRTACGGRPACLVKPWPDCWPSGGCSGIDYSRPNGAQRVNPTLEYRRDLKECIPPWEQTPEIRVVLQEYT